MRSWTPAVALVLLLPAACSKPAESSGSVSADAPTQAVAGSGAAAVGKDGVDTGGAIPVSVPRIAYTYNYGYRVPAADLIRLQQAHADLCEKRGPQVCRILDMQQSGSEGDYASGSLTLAVAAPRARAFGAELARLAGEKGGEQVAGGIKGEDLSKQIIDTEARVRARTLLRDRLMEVLASRKGTVAELVDAERAVAQVNEEIDAAQSNLADMKGRVDYSEMDLSYRSGAPSGGGFLEPVRGALGSVSTVLGYTVAMLITLATVLVPIGLLVWLGLFARRLYLRGAGRNASVEDRPDTPE